MVRRNKSAAAVDLRRRKQQPPRREDGQYAKNLDESSSPRQTRDYYSSQGQNNVNTLRNPSTSFRRRLLRRRRHTSATQPKLQITVTPSKRRKTTSVKRSKPPSRRWPVGQLVGNTPIGFVNVRLWRLAPTTNVTHPLEQLWIYRPLLLFHPLDLPADTKQELSHLLVYPTQTRDDIVESVAKNLLRYARPDEHGMPENFNQVYAIEIGEINYANGGAAAHSEWPTEVYLVWFPDTFLSARKRIPMQASTERSKILRLNTLTLARFNSATKDLQELAKEVPEFFFGTANRGKLTIVPPTSLAVLPKVELRTDLPVIHPQAHEHSRRSWMIRTLEELGIDKKKAHEVSEPLDLRAAPTFQNYFPPLNGLWTEAVSKGRGHFGFVLSLPWLMANGEYKELIVKLTNPKVSQVERELTISEATLPHIISSSRVPASAAERLVHIYGWTTYGKYFGVLMEKIQGGNMKEFVQKKSAKLAAAAKRYGTDSAQYANLLRHSSFEVLGILSDVAHALHAMHHYMKRVHRDVKSENVLIDLDGRAKLADFGMMALIGHFLGYAATKRYAPPDVIALREGSTMLKTPSSIVNGKVMHKDGAVDVWALAVMIVNVYDQGFALPREVIGVAKDILVNESMHDISVTAGDLLKIMTVAAKKMCKEQEDSSSSS